MRRGFIQRHGRCRRTWGRSFRRDGSRLRCSARLRRCGMRYPTVAAILLAAWATSGVAWGHIEAQYTLGRVATESTNIVLIEITRINKDKNLVICKKVRDLKGKHPGEEIKQNIGQ